VILLVRNYFELSSVMESSSLIWDKSLAANDEYHTNSGNRYCYCILYLFVATFSCLIVRITCGDQVFFAIVVYLLLISQELGRSVA
jgi:hypothetical protein